MIIRVRAGVIAGFAAVAAAVPATPVNAKWSEVFTDTPGAGGVACMALHKYPDETIMIAKMDRSDHDVGVVALSVMNLNWSIVDGQDLAPISLLHIGGGMSGKPVALNRGFVAYVPAQAFSAWADDIGSRQFAIHYDYRPLGRYNGDGLAATLRALIECSGREFR